MHTDTPPPPATPEQRADHLRRLLSCQHVTAARYTGTEYKHDREGNYHEVVPIADMADLSYGDIDSDWGAGYRLTACARPADWTPETLPFNAIVTIDYACYGDYGGSTVERANHTALCEDYKTAEWLKTIYGGHGSNGLAIDLAAWLDSLTDTDHTYADGSSILDTIEGLEDYPLVNDEAHSALEMELENEAIPEAVKDIARSIPWDRCRRLHTLIDELSADVAFECYRAACETTNTYAECQDAVSCYIDVKRIRAAFICEAYARRHEAASA